MNGVFRIGFQLIGKQQPILNSQNIIPLISQKCYITGKSYRAGLPPVVKPKPWPYETKPYGLLQAMFDKTKKRLDENSKLIVVEGPIASGKSQFAKDLAEELEMCYFPHANFDMEYINPYGYDMRQLDPLLPESCRSFEIKQFCENPNHRKVGNMQIVLYRLRYAQYIDALAHILSTGQGVVMDRCVYSDFVFLEAMHRNGYVSDGVKSVYHEIKENTITQLLKPHLVIYLDVPVNIVKDNIKKRGIDYEVKGKAFTDKYLTDIETVYKQNYLKDISVHAELLIYDWSACGETEVVVEDIERIDFEKFEENIYNKKMKDWRFHLEWDACEARITYCNDKPTLLNYFNCPRLDVPELLISAEDDKIRTDVWYEAPGMKYCLGYNKDMGDTGLLLKSKLDYRNSL